MFYDKTMEGADHFASCAPVDAIEAISRFDAVAPGTTACCDSSAFPAAQRGTWFDEGYDFREPVGAAITAVVLDAIAAVDTRRKKRCAEDQHNHAKMVRKLIANLIRCVSFHNPAALAVQLRASAYKGKPAWLNGKAMARTTKLLADAGLIECLKGRHGLGATTLAASPMLLFMALEAGATEQTLTYRMPEDSSIRLRQRNRDSELVTFDPTDETRAWTALLGGYNAFIAEQDIGLSLSAGELDQLTERMNRERAKGKLPYIKPELLRKCLYRQFNNGSFDDGGRLYGGWWINCQKELRKHIIINGKPTVELDFSGCLIRMLYHLAGIDYRDDPYWLAPLADCEAAHGLGTDHFREPVKRMMQAVINGREGKRNERIRMPSKQTFRPYFSRIEVAEMLKAKHAPIADAFFSEVGVKLQRLESDIALTIISNLKAKGIACLPIHDSFVVDAESRDDLDRQMISIYNDRFGYDPLVK